VFYVTFEPCLFGYSLREKEIRTSQFALKEQHVIHSHIKIIQHNEVIKALLKNTEERITERKKIYSGRPERFNENREYYEKKNPSVQPRNVTLSSSARCYILLFS
jgi:hypothetical protein